MGLVQIDNLVGIDKWAVGPVSVVHNSMMPIKHVIWSGYSLSYLKSSRSESKVRSCLV